MNITFEEGVSKLQGETRKRLRKNTFLIKIDDDTLGIQFHNTVVVYIFRSDIYQYDTGGWKNNATKNCINRYGTAQVSQRDSIWYVGEGIFEDGVRIDSFGHVITPQRGVDQVEANKRKLDLMISEYIKGFADYVLINGLAEKSDETTWEVVNVSKPLTPGPGDCWACFFGSSSNEHMKEPLGVKHLLEHMEEKYYVPSLLWKAIMDNYKSPGFIWRYISSEAKIRKTDFLKNVLKTYFRRRKMDLLDLM